MKKQNIIIFSSLGFIVLAIILYFAWLFWIGPTLHNQTLEEFSRPLLAVELPTDTSLEDVIKKVGQQIGNSDHCDYLTAMRLKTNLSRENLEQYYKTEYKGESEVQFIWLTGQNPYTAEEFDPLVIHSLRSWIKDNPTNASVVVYIFEAGMTSTIDYRCS